MKPGKLDPSFFVTEPVQDLDKAAESLNIRKITAPLVEDQITPMARLEDTPGMSINIPDIEQDTDTVSQTINSIDRLTDDQAAATPDCPFPSPSTAPSGGHRGLEQDIVQIQRDEDRSKDPEPDLTGAQISEESGSKNLLNSQPAQASKGIVENGEVTKDTGSETCVNHSIQPQPVPTVTVTPPPEQHDEIMSSADVNPQPSELPS